MTKKILCFCEEIQLFQSLDVLILLLYGYPFLQAFLTKPGICKDPMYILSRLITKISLLMCSLVFAHNASNQISLGRKYFL